MADSCPESVSATTRDKRVQFGNRFLNDPARVFQHNAWDNVEWSEEQEAEAERRVRENSAQRVPPEKQVDYEVNAHKYWNNFYKIHENGFFKDRHWLFTEFPELTPNQNKSNLKNLLLKDGDFEIIEHRNSGNGLGLIVSNTQEQHKASSHSVDDKEQKHPIEETTQNTCHLDINTDGFPGSSATYRILEVGCGVGNTVFPILHTNNDPGLFVYCCDFSTTAVDLVQTNSEYDPSRCFAFVHDLCDEEKSYPMPRESLDVIILIFVLSSIVPDKMQNAITRLSYLLKPGGMILLRDYGRYDMAQLRFKTGRCLSENFYVRGDGTRVYFFTQDELDTLFTTAGLEKVQNMVDHRLQVNRGKQLTMYRVWIQCKYRKPFSPNIS
ncbi:tRNA N(3)-methylcytidine methyltransferase METTL2A isoform X1 [Monodelphis domestica]|uniref:tRNA N(3)-cytidine methyltransferase n=1 Tax=Monodelphis domestica TaxID=13616 RepID=F6W5L3_MONDO|nr:tRNA N(3)-methylcytidine methyltransferase METTL2A isoform X1 [Monodelphis domestica]